MKQIANCGAAVGLLIYLAARENSMDYMIPTENSFAKRFHGRRKVLWVSLQVGQSLDLKGPYVILATQRDYLPNGTIRYWLLIERLNERWYERLLRKLFIHL